MTGQERRVAFITGAASGIGEATAELFAEQGMQVAVNAADEAAVAAVVTRIDAAGGQAVPAVADVTDAAAVHRAVHAVVQRFGRLDVLVASAGIQRYGTVTTTSEEIWDEVFAVNVKGAFLAVRECMPHLRRTRGSVVIISSVQATVPQTEVVAYAASKGALSTFTRAVAVDEAPRGVRVNSIAPGSIDTPMLRTSAALFGDDPDAVVASWGSTHPLGRVGTPREVAEAAAFLAGDHARFITGAELRVDGGLLSVLPAALPPTPQKG
jgi:NAD(P)-dependent dehydrogenase (short-subunit alcohol dehydrogenase family)